MDPVGIVLVMGGIISYTLALQYGGVAEAWNSAHVVGLLVGFAAIFIVFGVWEYFQGERATITPRLFRQRHVWTGSLAALFMAGSYFLIIYYLPIYFQSIDGVDPTQSGVRNLPLILAVTFATVASGVSISQNGIAAPVMVGGLVLATISTGLLYTLDIGTGSGKWIGFQILAGVGFGVAFQVPMIIAQAMSAADDLAATTAIIMCKLIPSEPRRAEARANSSASLPNHRRRILRGGGPVELHKHHDQLGRGQRAADQPGEARPHGRHRAPPRLLARRLAKRPHWLYGRPEGGLRHRHRRLRGCPDRGLLCAVAEAQP